MEFTGTISISMLACASTHQPCDITSCCYTALSIHYPVIYKDGPTNTYITHPWLNCTPPSEMTSLTAENFPNLLNDRLLKAARGEKVDRAPVWVMRQVRVFFPCY